MMDDKSVNKYIELISNVEYDINEKEKLFESVTNKLENNNNVQIEKVNSLSIAPGVKTDKCYKKYSFILRLASVLVLFAVVLIPIIPKTRNMIADLYNRLYQIQATATPHVTPSYTLKPTPSVTPTASSTITPSPTKEQTPEPTEFKYVFDTEETRSFTEEEELLNKVYHAMFPERADYIAYWAGENIFWAPANLGPNMPIWLLS